MKKLGITIALIIVAAIIRANESKSRNYYGTKKPVNPKKRDVWFESPKVTTF